MSFDDYALSLAQKYRLAISMAILKTKPENLTVTDYIEEIRDVINDRNKNTSQQDLDMTACSDDFNIDDEDIEITKIDLPHDTQNYRNIKNNKVQDTMHIVQNIGIDVKLTNYAQVNDKEVINKFNEDKNEIIVKGRRANCSKRQGNYNIKQYNGKIPQENGNIIQNDGDIIECYEKREHIDKTKIKSKVIELSSGKTQDIDVPQEDYRLQESTHIIQETSNITQITDTNNVTEKRDSNKERKEKFREVIRILKGVDVTIDKVAKEKHVQTPGIIKSFDPTDLDLTQCYGDNNDTFLHMDRLAVSDCNIMNVQDKLESQQSKNNETFILCSSTSKKSSETVTIASSKDKQEVRKRKTEINVQKSTNSDAKLIKIVKTDVERVKTNSSNSKSNAMYCAKENSQNEANNKGQNEVNFALKTTILDNGNNLTEVSNNIVQNENVDGRVINTQDTQFNTHYSESQMFDIIFDKNLIYGNKDQNIGINAETDKLIDKDHGNTDQQNIEDRTISIFTHKTQGLPKSRTITDKTKQNEFVFSITQSQDAFPCQGFYTKINDCIEIDPALSFDTNDRRNIDTEFTIDILQNDRKINNDLQTQYNNVLNKQKHQIFTERDDLIENNTAFSQTQNINVIQNSLKPTQIYEENKKSLSINNDLVTMGTENENDCTDFDISNEIDEANIVEKVPFKILEEMNQIKSYLSKKREFKDSGYKSSQSQRSGIGTQPSCVRVGESADSVFIYLSSCPLDVATQDLNEQISEVLGQIIDRLHEEEIYPKFLEELLNTVEKNLHLVYEESYDFDVLQKKDDQIQRIILLNKSYHIKKYTIEKINKILQKLLDEVSEPNYEIEQINKLENLCYIFHILQIILPKYIQGNLYNSQTSQNSQEQKILKKQDISDIWRKKWFTNCKENENEGSFENKCVLKECSTILNKIIVNFMDGYSLIAFSALKCFNLIQ